MISYLEGAVTASDERSVIIQTDKIGWRVFLGTNTLAKVQKNKDLVKVFAHLHDSVFVTVAQAVHVLAETAILVFELLDRSCRRRD